MIDSFSELCIDLASRTILDGSRFEAGRFGANQHSSASAGAVINGLCRIPVLPKDTRLAITDQAFALISDAGVVRGHDDNLNDGNTSWSLSQLLFGLAVSPHKDRYINTPNFQNALKRLLRYQDATTGKWHLRDGDFSDISLSFYPALLFTNLISLPGAVTLADRETLANSLQLTATHLVAELETEGVVAFDRTLAISALEIISRAIFPSMAGPTRVYTQSLIRDFFSESGQLSVNDRTIQNHIQPRWHSTGWSPLLYLCTRRWGSVSDSYNMRIADLLLESFDPVAMGWRGPSSAGPATSWASSLAAFAVWKMANDLVRSDIDAATFRAEAANIRPFDIVISFGRSDRKVAHEIRDHLINQDLRVFYDADYRHKLLGEDLAVLLHRIYFDKSRYAIAVISEGFVESKWASNIEWRSVLARMASQQHGYVLPYFVQQVEVPGLQSTIGYISAEEFTPTEFAQIVVKKLRS
jgi:hypothetical protein